jgi:hypothetical protein
MFIWIMNEQCGDHGHSAWRRHNGCQIIVNDTQYLIEWLHIMDKPVANECQQSLHSGSGGMSGK